MATNNPTTGRRDRKKAETRTNIARAAVELFANEGPEHTTIANIAAHADISTRTFHNYFPNREAALLHHLEEMMDNLARTINNTPDGHSVIDATRNLANELYFHPNEPLNSIHTLRCVAEHLAHTSCTCTTTDGVPRHHDRDDKPNNDPVAFTEPLVRALQHYAQRNGQRLSTFHASLLLNNAIWICANISETSTRPEYADGRSDKDMLREAFELTTTGFATYLDAAAPDATSGSGDSGSGSGS